MRFDHWQQRARRMFSRWRSWAAVAMLAALPAMAAQGQDDVKIVAVRGVGDGLVLAGPREVEAFVKGNPGRVEFTMRGPEGWVRLTKDFAAPYSFMNDVNNEPVPWDFSENPEGNYMLAVRAVVRGQVVDRRVFEFQVDSDGDGVVEPTPLQQEVGDKWWLSDEWREVREQRLLNPVSDDTSAGSGGSNGSTSGSGGSGVTDDGASADNGGTTPVDDGASADNGDTTPVDDGASADNGGTADPTPDGGGQDTVTALPDVNFPGNMPTTYTRGSGQSFDLVLDGPMPDNGDIVVIAWSQALDNVVPAFAHTLSGAPWRIDGAKMDQLPAGQVVVQLLVRSDYEIQYKVPHPMTVVVSTASSDDGSSGSGGSTDSGSGGSTDSGSGDTTDGGSTSPSGGTSADAGGSGSTGSGGSTGSDDSSAGTDDTTGGDSTANAGTGTGGSTTEPGEEPQPEPADLQFAADAPSTHTRGETTEIGVEVVGDMPDGADVMFLAWSEAEGRMVEGFAHVVYSEPFVIETDRLDALPEGGNQLQAFLRSNGQNLVKVTHTIDVLVPESTDETPIAGEPTQPDSPDYVTTGFTTFTKSADTRVVYVSSSEGDDRNDGLSPQTPVRSINRGESLVRDGYPDWLLFKAGDVFEGGLGGWGKSGRSETERMLVGVYGQGPRPLFRTGGDSLISSAGGHRAHVAFVGLHGYPNHRDPNSPDYDPNVGNPTGIRFQGGTIRDILIEDCKLELYKDNIVFQGWDTDPKLVTDIKIRRNIIVNSYSANSHSQGIFVTHVDGLLIEENTFDHNGWNLKVADADPTKFNHNMYVQNTSLNITVRGNISARAASHGSQVRPGGTVEGNLFVRNSLAFFVTRADSVVRGNLVLEGKDISDELPRGAGISTHQLTNVWIEDNIISTKIGGMNYPGLRAGGNAIRYHNNVVYDWPNNDGDNVEINGTVVSQSGNRTDDDNPYVDPGRNVATYMASIGLEPTLEAFLEAAASRPRGVWDERFTPAPVYEHVKQGFEFLPYD